VYNEHINHGDADVYKVNETTYSSFLAAIDAAKKIGANVVLASNGSVKWSPAPAVSKKKMRKYYGDLAAYEAYKKIS